MRRTRWVRLTMMAILMNLLPIMWSHGAGGRRDETDCRADDRRRNHFVSTGASGVSGDL
jgi:hypothetical protein